MFFKIHVFIILIYLYMSYDINVAVDSSALMWGLLLVLLSFLYVFLEIKEDAVLLIFK